MASPIELRQFLRRFTLDDARNGVQPIRQVLANGRVELYSPPVLQVRTRERTNRDGQVALEWGEWRDTLFVREGDDAPGDPPKAA